MITRYSNCQQFQAGDSKLRKPKYTLNLTIFGTEMEANHTFYIHTPL
jgi:hypothetical protein